MAKSSPAGRKVEHTHKLRMVPLGQIRPAPAMEGQRDLQQSWVDRLCEELDLNQIGRPVVNHRDGIYWCIDGQHRVAALLQFGFDPADKIECDCYTDLTDAEMAEAFLLQNTTLTVKPFDKFRNAVTAGRPVECEVNRVVLANGCHVSRSAEPGAISAVQTLTKILKRSDAKTLGRTIRIVRDAYGDPGFQQYVIDGIALLCQRYNGQLDDEAVIAKLGSAYGGVGGLTNKAETIRRTTGAGKASCVAAAAVEIVNAGRGGKKLPSWWAS